MCSICWDCWSGKPIDLEKSGIFTNDQSLHVVNVMKLFEVETGEGQPEVFGHM